MAVTDAHRPVCAQWVGPSSDDPEVLNSWEVIKAREMRAADDLLHARISALVRAANSRFVQRCGSAVTARVSDTSPRV